MESTYQILIGNGKKEKRKGIKGEGTLLKVVFGIGTTTEEAVLYFYYTGKNLLCDEPAMSKIFNILFNETICILLYSNNPFVSIIEF